MIGDIFGPDGALSRVLTRAGRPTGVRTPQRHYAEHVYATQASRQPVFVDAETGVGKTLGYLIPTMLSAFSDPDKRPLVVVSTASVALQRQLINDDIPIALAVIKDVLGVYAKAEIRVGRQQIVDPDRLEQAVSEIAEAADSGLAADIGSWVHERISEGVLPLRTDLLEAFADRLVGGKGWLSVAAIGLLEADDTTDVGELYVRHIERCENAHILVINHHLLALNMLRPFLWDQERPLHLVVDEADRLPSVVESLTRRAVPLHALATNLHGVPDSESAAEAITDLSVEVMKHFGVAWRGANGGVSPVSHLDHVARATLSAKMKVAAETLNLLLDTSDSPKSRRSPEARERISQLARAAHELGSINEEIGSLEGNALLYYSPIRSYPGIASIRSGSARMIAGRLWTKPKFNAASLTFTSATLASMASSPGEADVKRAFLPFISECGFNVADIHQRSCALIAPENFGDMSFVRPPFDAPSPFESCDGDVEVPTLRQDAVDMWSRMVVSAAAESGRVLVLCPSHRDVSALTDALCDLGDRLVSQKPGVPTNVAITRFLSRNDSVWISASAWEGVSLPGAISHIVIPRLPIRPSSLEDNLLERYFSENGAASKGRSIVFGRRLAEARRGLRQGIGRGIRSAADSVKIWIGDYRWPLTQTELDRDFRDQPTTWSSTMIHSVPKRFRKKLEGSPRFREH